MNGIRRQQYLEEIGITVWLERKLVDKETTNFNVKTISEKNKSFETELDKNLDHLSRQIETCKLCELHKSRTKTVFGIGNKNADWLVIGEAPGADEDLIGEPFVGPAGKLLNAKVNLFNNNNAEVNLVNSEDGISPGQACVFYKKDQYGHKVLGGGWIKE